MANIKLNSKTSYRLNARTGEGRISTLAGDLDRVIDAVAQDIGYPIESGTWEETGKGREMVINFAVAESAMADFRRLAAPIAEMEAATATPDVIATFYAQNFDRNLKRMASGAGRTRRWTVRIRRPGDSWGLNGKLTHKEGDEPAIEFYDGGTDAQAALGPVNGNRDQYGQLVSSYYVSTLLEDAYQLATGGLSLDGGVPVWAVDGDLMRQVFQFIDFHRDYWEPSLTAAQKAEKKADRKARARKAVRP